MDNDAIDTADLITLWLEWDEERAHLEGCCGGGCAYCAYEASVDEALREDAEDRRARRDAWLAEHCPGCGVQHGCRCPGGAS
jgi:hypothetical protein